MHNFIYRLASVLHGNKTERTCHLGVYNYGFPVHGRWHHSARVKLSGSCQLHRVVKTGFAIAL